MVNRIYITGPVGSGKSTLARRLSEVYGFACCELDGIVYESDAASSTGNRKRPEAERDALLYAVLSHEKWVVEDAGRACFEIAWRRADSIILLEAPVSVRVRRILLRWVRQKLRIEQCGYTPNFTMLILMFHWTRNYDSGADSVKERLRPYQSKLSVIRNKRDIETYVNKYIR